jgi:hypothetical protein
VAGQLVWVAASHLNGQQHSTDHTCCNPMRILILKQ